MDAGFAHTTESLFGPASEVIDVFDFLQSATVAIGITRAAESPTIPAEIAEECRWVRCTAMFGRPLDV
jgi:hypothetical protein